MVKMTTNEKDVIYLKIALEGEVKKRFLLVKKKLGIESNSDLVRLLISQEHDKLFGSP